MASASVEDLFEQLGAAVLDVPQIGRRIRPGEVALEGLLRIDADQHRAHEREVVNAEGARGSKHPAARAAWPAGACLGRRAVKQRAHREVCSRQRACRTIRRLKIKLKPPLSSH